MIVHLDTSVLVDLIRERAREKPGPASAFLARHLDDELRTSLFAACELMLGVERSELGPYRRPDYEDQPDDRRCELIYGRRPRPGGQRDLGEESQRVGAAS